MPVPEQPMVLSEGPLEFTRPKMGDVSARVPTLEMMLAIKANPRPDETDGSKDRADLAVLRSVVESRS